MLGAKPAQAGFVTSIHLGSSAWLGSVSGKCIIRKPGSVIWLGKGTSAWDRDASGTCGFVGYWINRDQAGAVECVRRRSTDSTVSAMYRI